MGYTCGNCGVWVNDNENHQCFSNLKYYTFPSYWGYQSNRTVKCRKKECIYWSAESLYGSDIDRCDGYCGNYSLLMDEFGMCRCFVKRKKETEQ